MPATTACYAFDRYAATVVRNAVAAAAKPPGRPSLQTVVLMHSQLELEPGLLILKTERGRLLMPGFAAHGRFPSHVDEAEDGGQALSAFCARHRLPEKGFTWGDTYRLPRSLLTYELILASLAVGAQLAKRGFTILPDARIGLGDSARPDYTEKDLAMLAGRIATSARTLLKTPSVQRDFAALVYATEPRRAWFLGLCAGTAKAKAKAKA